MTNTRTQINAKYAELEQSYTPSISSGIFQARVNSLKDSIKQLNYPHDTGLRLVKVGMGRKHELREVGV